VEAMGGPPTAGVGFGMGMDRLLIVAESAGGEKLAATRPLQVAFVALDAESARALVPVMHGLRKRGVAADMDYTRRKLEKQIRAAAEAGAALAVISGDDEREAGEATLQDLATRSR